MQPFCKALNIFIHIFAKHHKTHNSQSPAYISIDWSEKCNYVLSICVPCLRQFGYISTSPTMQSYLVVSSFLLTLVHAGGLQVDIDPRSRGIQRVYFPRGTPRLCASIYRGRLNQKTCMDLGYIPRIRFHYQAPNPRWMIS